MALYVIGDTHFSEGCNKPMDIFGGAWTGYRDKLVESLSVLQPEDVLVLAGDFSWGMSLQEALPDFRLLDSFPGKKLLLKGNHDYWWETVSKMKRFFAENAIETIDFLHNSCYFYNGVALCGTRGWFYDKNDPAAGDDKIFKRELLRLEASLQSAGELPKTVFLHYPPKYKGYECPEILELLRDYGVRRCFYGHLHGASHGLAMEGPWNGIEFKLVSADRLNFCPLTVIS